MYGVPSQAAYLHSCVNSDYSGYNWQERSSQQQSYAQQDQWNNYTTDQNATYRQPHSMSQQPMYQQREVLPSQDPLKMPDGRPPHTVVAFGFGGTFAVIKQYGRGAVEMQSLSSLLPPSPGLELSTNSSKADVLKWIDDRASNSAYEEGGNSQGLALLWGTVKIALEHQGRLRSDKAGINGPDAALVQLIFSSSTNPSSQGCLQNFPTQDELEATALKVNGFLLCGKRQQALQCAQEGNMWGIALVLAAQLGNEFYYDTVSKMASNQVGALRTYSLLAGGQPDLFGSYGQPTELQESLAENWAETLALMATNRMIGDEARLTQFGDMLWSSKGEVAVAHICYLLADHPQASFSDGRICLIGADHWRQPRTFATPLAIKRTQLYEQAKKMSNSQFALERFQPYQVLYANMLAEAGQLQEALRCCQTVLKTLKSARRDPTLEACNQAAADLEKRLHMSLEHGQGSYTMLAGRILSNTYSYVRSSLPTSKLTRYNSAVSMQSAEIVSATKVPSRSLSEPDFNSRTAAPSTTSTPSPGLLRRVSSNVYQRAASLVGMNKQPEMNDEENYDQGYNEALYVQAMTDNTQPSPFSPQQEPSSLYTQCSGYYSRSSELVKSLVPSQLPQLPPVFRFGKASQVQRVEV